jgi:hypothetical protein
MVLAVVWGCAMEKSVRYTHEEIKDLPPNVQDRIMKGEVMLGMTPREVRYAWGPPESVRFLTPYEGKTREEWTYTRLGVYETKKLLFLDGRLFYMVPEPGTVLQTGETKPQAAGGQPAGAAQKEQVQETIRLQEPAAK